jgi:hypothetical protein
MHDLNRDMRCGEIWRKGEPIGDLCCVEAGHDLFRLRVVALEQSLPLAALEVERFGSCGSQASCVSEDHLSSISPRKDPVTLQLTHYRSSVTP